MCDQNIQNNKIYIGRTAQKNPIKYIKKHFQLNQLKTFLKYYYYSNQIQINKKASDMLNKLYNLYGLLTEGKIDLKKIFPLIKYNI